MIGSRLWLLRRSKLIENETVRLAEEYIREALQWMIDDGLVLSIDVTLTRDDVNSLTGEIVLNQKLDGALRVPFLDIWQVIYAV